MNVGSHALFISMSCSYIAVEGVKERLQYENASSQSHKGQPSTSQFPQTSRRRKGPLLTNALALLIHPSLGPAFLPSEHDELPPGVAFMVSPP